MMSLLLLLLSFPIPLWLSEDITLRRGNEVICLSDIDSSIYLDPPFIGKHNNSTIFLQLGHWDTDNWIIKNQNEIMGPIIHKRWEDFKVYKNKTFSLDLMVKSLSVELSVYSPGETQLYLRKELKWRKFDLNVTEQGWTHFNLTIANLNVHLLQNDKTVVNETIDFEPKVIMFRRANETLWKSHEYQFRWSDTVTNGTPTTLAIPPIAKECLMVYLYLCENCSLRIPEFNRTFTFRSENGLNSWQTNRIDITPKKETKISLVKGKTDDNEDGYWGIDIAECPDIIDNKAVYRENVSMDVNNSTTLCRHLHAQRGVEIKINYENQTQEDGFSCEPGKLGNNCTIRCKDILGVDKQYCQEYKICYDSKCECAWGYKGSECDSQCDKGHWGLSCKSICQEGCEKCHHITGKCADSANIGMIIGIIIIGAGALLLVISFLAEIQRWKLRYQGVSTENPDHRCEAI
jgi:hypothetical protein